MLIANPQRGHPTPSRFRSFKGKDYVVAELRYDSGVAVSTAGLRAPAARESTAAALNSILDGFNVRSCGSHFGLPDAALRTRAVDAPRRMPKTVSAGFAQSGVIQIIPQRARDCDDLARRLKRYGAIWNAYKAPQPMPAAVSPNMEPCQGYLCSAPDGIRSCNPTICP